MEESYRECFNTGRVVRANPKTLTCDVMRSSDESMLYDVPILNSTGGPQSTDLSWGANIVGALVCYTYLNGQPHIVGVIPTQVTPDEQVSLSTSETGTGGDNTRTYGYVGDGFAGDGGSGDTISFSGGRNAGWMPTDKVISTDGGAELALLSEGGVVLKASPLAKLVLGGLMNFARIVAREFSIHTDFGEMRFLHGSSGRTGLVIEGGDLYSKETQAGEGTNTVHLHMGYAPNAANVRFGMRVNSTDDIEYSAITFGRDGKLNAVTSKDHLLSVGKDNHTRVLQDDYVEIDGDQTVQVGKGRATSVSEDETTLIVGNEEHFVGNERTVTVTGQEMHMTGGDLHIQVGRVIYLGANGFFLSTSHIGENGEDLLGDFTGKIGDLGLNARDCDIQARDFDMKVTSLNIGRA